MKRIELGVFLVAGMLILHGAGSECLAAAGRAQNPQDPQAWLCGNGVCDPDETRQSCRQDCTLLKKLVRRLSGETGLDFPEQPSQQPGDYALSLPHDGLTRTYKVHVPPSYRAGTPAPLVLYIHGGAGNARAAYIDGMAKEADKFGFILAAPEATRAEKRGDPPTGWNGGAWAGGQCCGSADDVGFIAQMIQELEHTFAIDARRIYATGISNGGLMTNRLACELSETIAAVATVAPAGLIQSCRPARAIPVMDIHGTGDRCNPFEGGVPPLRACANVDYRRMSPHKMVSAWRAILGCSAEAIPAYEQGAASCVSYRQCQRGGEVEFCQVEGMGHVWPSGSQYVSPRLVGPVSYDISFDQIWDFFQRHPLKQE